MSDHKSWWRRGSNSRGITPIGNQERLKSDALDQLGHATLTIGWHRSNIYGAESRSARIPRTVTTEFSRKCYKSGGSSKSWSVKLL